MPVLTRVSTRASVTDLRAFLAQHPVDSDLRLLAWATDAGQSATCELATSPWWSAPSDRGPDNGRLRVILRDVAASEIVLGWRAAEIEDLDVTDDDPRLWHWGRHGRIYGNSRLPDPFRFYTQFAVALQDLRYPGGIAAVLGSGRIQEWVDRVSGPGAYALLDGPEPVVDAARPLLDAQGVEYVALFGPEPNEAARALLLVTVGESWVICGRADVEASLTAG